MDARATSPTTWRARRHHRIATIRIATIRTAKAPRDRAQTPATTRLMGIATMVDLGRSLPYAASAPTAWTAVLGRHRTLTIHRRRRRRRPRPRSRGGRGGQFFRADRIARSPPMGCASLMGVATMATTSIARFELKCRWLLPPPCLAPRAASITSRLGAHVTPALLGR